MKTRLLLLEAHTRKKQTQLRRFLRTLEDNSRKTGFLNTKNYSKYIEPIIDSILINHEENNWNFFWRKSHVITKIHFFYILLIPLSLFFAIQLEFGEEEIVGDYFFALPFLIAVIIMFAVTLIIINIFLYYIIISLLKVFNFESGVLIKNVATLEAVTDSIKFYKNSAIILGVAGILGSGAASKLGGFKGMGGGKFGGGGAGGSW